MPVRNLKGVLPVLPTPFLPNGDVDEPGLRSLVDYAVANGAGGLCAPMFASEYYKLSDEEIRAVTRVMIEHTAGRVPVVAQCNHASLRGVMALAESAAAAGADWIGVLVPHQFRLGAPDVERFYTEICRHSPVPVLAQDADYAGGVLPVEAIVRLTEQTANFRAVKLEGPLNGPKFHELKQRTAGKLMLTSGWAGLDIFDAVSRGVDGVVPALAMLPTYVQCWNAFTTGQRELGFAALAQFMPLATLAMQHLELLHYIEKRMLVRRGVIRYGTVREPTLAIEPGYREQIEQMIDYYLKGENYT